MILSIDPSRLLKQKKNRSGDDSYEVNVAFSYVQMNIPAQHYKIVDNLEEARNYKFLIIIAHGTPEVLKFGNSEQSWENIGQKIRNSSILQIFTFACDGSYLSPFLPSNIKLVSFNGVLDAKIGGLLAATAISLLVRLDIQYLVEQLIERVDEIEKGEELIKLGKYYRSDKKKIYKKLGFIKIHIDTSGYIDWLYTDNHVASWQFEMSAWSAAFGFANILLGFIVSTYAWWISTSSACISTNAISYGIDSKISRLTTDLELNCDQAYPYPYPTSIPLPVPGALWIDIISLFDTNGDWYWMST